MFNWLKNLGQKNNGFRRPDNFDPKPDQIWYRINDNAVDEDWPEQVTIQWIEPFTICYYISEERPIAYCSKKRFLEVFYRPGV
jgi:hypothetical protein